jgi:hypothetical protein
MAVAKNKRGGSAYPEWWVRMIGTVGQLAAEYTYGGASGSSIEIYGIDTGI